MNQRYYDYTILVSIRHIKLNGGSRYERFGPFRFCCANRDEAISLASSNVKSRDGEKQIQVTAALLV